MPGSTVHLSANSTNADSYVWFHNGNVIPETDNMYYDATKEGIYWVLALSEEGCASDFSEDLEILFKIPDPKVIQHQQFCTKDNAVLDDIAISGTNIKWYKTQTSNTPLEHSFKLVTGIYYVSQTINGKESERIAVYISIVDCSDLFSITKTAFPQAAAIGNEVIFTISVKNLTSYDITEIFIEENIQSGFSFMSYEASHGNYNVQLNQWYIPNLPAMKEAKLKIKVKVLPHGDYYNIAKIISSVPNDYVTSNNFAQFLLKTNCLTIYNEFSPNNDGKNDYFKIECIENYPNNTLRIYNRWGQLVYEKSGYDNSWNGLSNRKSGMIKKGEVLPKGTYFYNLGGCNLKSV